ncbi:MAG: GntR family transcriptional regulator [Candidatus Competibacterales bacterium]|nr:GntR family transcriptional regulator [Candidatus Competibacterales bacterium]
MSGPGPKPPRAARRPTRSALRQGPTPANAPVEIIFERIEAAITEHRLPPGTKLGEEYLCGIFGVSRTKVRQALFRLADEKLVTLLPRRGAFVAQPSEQEARDVFEARRTIECAIVDRFARNATPPQIARLRTQHHKERKAADDNALYIGTARGTRFLGQFHFMLAELAGNQVLAELLHELTARTAVIEILYESTMTSGCSVAEHAELLDCIERGDAAAAARSMAEHLSHIERCLRLRPSAAAGVDLEAVLRPGPD